MFMAIKTCRTSFKEFVKQNTACSNSTIMPWNNGLERLVKMVTEDEIQ